MKIRKLIRKLNPENNTSEQDLNCFSYQLTHGQPYPFFRDDALSDVSIQSIIRVNRNYDLIILASGGEKQLSKKTLEKWVHYRWNEHHTDATCCKYSDDFRNQIKASFVILKHQDFKRWPLLAYIDRMLLGQQMNFMAIDGMAASGKSSLAKMLGHIFKAAVIHIDDFFKKPAPHSKNIEANYGNNIDFDNIYQTIIKPLKSQKDVIYRPFDTKTHRHLEPMILTYRPFVIIEGAYSMHPYLKAAYDACVWMETSYLQAILRIWKRNGGKRLWQFIRIWMPKERKYRKALHPKQKARFIIKT